MNPDTAAFVKALYRARDPDDFLKGGEREAVILELERRKKRLRFKRIILKVTRLFHSNHHNIVADVADELEFVEQVLQQQGFLGLIPANAPTVAATRPASRQKTRLVWNNVDECLFTFLCGTTDIDSPLILLRGQADVLRKIFTLACEEFWMSHIVVGEEGIPQLPTAFEAKQSKQQEENYRDSKGQYLGGAPAAILEQNVGFPKPSKIAIGKVDANPYFVKDTKDDTVGHLYVNMLPFDIKDKGTLPDELKQYWPIIELCSRRIVKKPSGHCTGYLTIDERPVCAGNSQRRPGVHCESPSVIAVPESDAKGGNMPNFIAHAKNGCYIPGAEHHWGRGIMMRGDRLVGGIYMCSNVDNSTAVWNHYINDHNGEIIGPHGDMEHVRHLLGPPTKLLKKGELVWMTDKTPHESVPLQRSSERQYFRLVCGEVSAWFSQHSTRNPKFTIPSNVRIVHENKFKMNKGKFPRRWLCGSATEISMLNEVKRLSMLLRKFGLCHLLDRWVSNGVNTVEKLYYLLLLHLHNYHRSNVFERLKLNPSVDVQNDFLDRHYECGWYYFEARQLKKLYDDLLLHIKDDAREELLARTAVDILWEARQVTVKKKEKDIC